MTRFSTGNIYFLSCSFVRSVTMDKWKDVELEKMKVGGNRQCKEFFRSQPDYKENWGFQNKWNSKAAALYRDKVPVALPSTSFFGHFVRFTFLPRLLRLPEASLGQQTHLRRKTGLTLGQGSTHL